MAEFYPSEIARLVLGYLEEIKCLKAWEVFLEECIDLQEHKRQYKDGKFCTTTVNGKSLLDILSDYCLLKKTPKESSQQHSTNTYQVYGVYKTPSKNESAYATYSINQRIQTKSVVKSGVKSPKCNSFRSPTSRPSCKTARRRLECQTTTLNFGPEAQTSPEKNLSNSNTNQSKQFVFISASSSTQACSNSPQVTRDMCLSSPGAPTRSNNRDQRDGPYSEPPTGSKNVARTDSEKVNFLSCGQPQTPEIGSSQVINASESDVREKCHTPDGIRSNISEKCDTPGSTHSEVSEFRVDKQTSLTTVTCNTAVAQSSVRTVVSRSAEIATNSENVFLSLSDSCSTPQYETDPPPYHRAPDTNSPRIVLSHDRSLLPSFTTPSKDQRLCPEEEWSPKRKGSIPRRRLIIDSPSSKLIQNPEPIITFDSVLENLLGPDEMLFNDTLVQLLTENINKVKQSESKEADVEGLDDLVKKVAESTEEDPAFEKFIAQMCGNSEHYNIDSSSSKLPEIDCETISDEHNTDKKEANDKTNNAEPSQETTQNASTSTELEHAKDPTTQETGHSSKESLVTSENNLQLSVIDSQINQAISSVPQEVLDFNINNQLDCTPKSTSPENETDKLENVNKSDDSPPSLSVKDNCEKGLLSEEVSSVIAVDNDASIITVENDIVDKDTSAIRTIENDIRDNDASDIIGTVENDIRDNDASDIIGTVENHIRNKGTSTIRTVGNDIMDKGTYAIRTVENDTVDNVASSIRTVENNIGDKDASAIRTVKNDIGDKDASTIRIVENSVGDKDTSAIRTVQNGIGDKDISPIKTVESDVVDNDTSAIRTIENDPVDNEMSVINPVENDVVLNNTSLNNHSGVKTSGDLTESIQNIIVDPNNASQTNNISNITSTINQPASNIQMTVPNPTVTQFVNPPSHIASPQPNALLEISIPTAPAILLSTLCPDGTVQSNLYRFIMNPVYNPPPLGGITLPLPTAPAQNFTSPLIVPSAPTVPLLNVQNTGNSKTVPRPTEKTVATPESTKSLVLDIGSSDKEITPNTTPSDSSAPPKKRQKTSRKPKASKNDPEQFVSPLSSKVPAKSKKKYTKKDKNAKKKLLSLFPVTSPLKSKKTAFQTPVKDSEDDIPVLSIPEPSPSSQSSAFKYFSQITGQIERGDRSPVLKSLMSQAAVLSDKKSRCTSTYVRCLDFTSDSKVQNKNNDSVQVVRNNKTTEPALSKGESNAGSRRSVRLQRRKAEMLNESKVTEPINVQQLKRKLNVDSSVTPSPTDQVKITESDNFISPVFKEAIVVLNSIDDAQAIQRHEAEMIKDSEVTESINVQQSKKKMNVDSAVNSSSTDQVKTVESDNFSSPMFSKALDVLNCLVDAPVIDNDIDLGQSDQKENSDVADVPLHDLLSLNQTVVAKKSEKNQQKEIEVIDLDDSDNSLNMLNNISVFLPEKNNSISNLNKQESQVKEKRKVKNIYQKLKNTESNIDLKKGRDVSKKSSVQRKNKTLFSAKSSSSFSSIPTCMNSELAAEKTNNKNEKSISDINDTKNSVAIDKSPESHKPSCTRLDLLLFGSDNEFTPEKDPNSCIQKKSVLVSPPSVTTSAVKNLSEKDEIILPTAESTIQNKFTPKKDTNSCNQTTNVPVSSSSVTTHLTKKQSEVSPTTAETIIQNSKSQNISSKLLSSLGPKQSPKYNSMHSFSNAVNPHLEDKLPNLIDNNNESPSGDSPEINASKDFQHDAMKSEMLASSKTAVAVQNTDLMDAGKKGHSIGEKTNVSFNNREVVNKNRHVLKSKTPQKKSLDSIISFCKESAGYQRISKTPLEFSSYKKTLTEISLHSDSKISPITDMRAYKLKDGTDCAQVINKTISVKNKSMENASHSPTIVRISPGIQKNSPENKSSTFIRRTKSISAQQQSVTMSQSTGQSSVVDNSTLNSEKEISRFTSDINQQLHNLHETSNQKVKATISSSLHNSKEVPESFLAASGASIELLAKNNISPEQNINSSETSKSIKGETNKVLPPPKKRIRPIPVDSSSNESFSSPFKKLLNSPSISKCVCPITNNANKQVLIQSHLNVCEPVSNIKSKEKSAKTADVPVTDFVPVCVSANASDLNDKTSLTHFISHSKQSTIIVEDKSPSLNAKTESIPPSPISVSQSPAFKQPFVWRSGKPRAMVEIYKNAFPNKNGELPISPVSFSNSSSTFDALPAKRRLLEDSPSSSSSNQVQPAEFSKEIPKNITAPEKCDYSGDLDSNKSDSVQQEVIIEKSTIETQNEGNGTCKTLRTYSRLRHVKNNSKTSSFDLLDAMHNVDGDSFVLERKRKKSDSSSSDDCSTVVDFEGELMTPMKDDDWRKKDLFRISPTVSEKSHKNRSSSVSSYDSDISPEKLDPVNKETGLPQCKLKEINATDIPQDSTIVSNTQSNPQNLIKNCLTNPSDANLVNNVINSSPNVHVSNIDEGIDESDCMQIDKNVSKSTVAEIVQKNNECEKVQPHSKKRKVSSDKKERRSRPTLKIASIISPSKKKQDLSSACSSSKMSSIKRTAKRKFYPNIPPRPLDKSVKKCPKTSNAPNINSAKCTTDQNADVGKEISERNANSSDRATRTVLEKVKTVSESNAVLDQKSVISPKKVLETLDHCETTQDIVESDIGRSSDAGSELSIAIASCERELLNSQNDNCSQSPRYQSNFGLVTPIKTPSHNHDVQHFNPSKMDSDGAKYNLLMDKINMLSPEKLNSLLEKIIRDKE